MDKQAGGSFPSISRSSDPLNDRQDSFQAETGNKKAYVLAPNLKMPSIELVEKKENSATVRDIPATSKANFRADSDPTGENLHNQFVSNELDSPGSFGHGA